jgi:hypothetical protein
MMTSMLGVNTVTVGDVPYHSMGPDRLPTIADAMAATTGISGEASYWATAFGPRRCSPAAAALGVAAFGAEESMVSRVVERRSTNSSHCFYEFLCMRTQVLLALCSTLDVRAMVEHTERGQRK